ncbi:hypothetical protein [Streptosporangium pseudovulgare]|uniref:Uncharacterized protein n=1 Tax=Streptosporangium pseudovulgare TaxID=35765 RepID=A0ABQ2R967_9ACTN|nr:hypothetical protein [Streptosporangium pseudovulgare]GGQ20080.1 hypothetical protein GCM10010140_58110 [Streptosporangium pseudovulgare]
MSGLQDRCRRSAFHDEFADELGERREDVEVDQFRVTRVRVGQVRAAPESTVAARAVIGIRGR